VKVLVVDDEALARDRLRQLLARVAPAVDCVEASSGQAALAEVARSEPDLVLLDIRMPEMDGIDVAAQLDELANPPAVIFCTAYDEYALDALRHQAVAYLLKPVRESDLQRALDSAGRVNRVQLNPLRSRGEATDGRGRRTICAQTHRGLETMAVADIGCFVAEDKYVTAYGAQGSLVIPDTLKDLEDEFGDEFLRVHRKALVAVAHVSAMEHDGGGRWYLTLSGVAQRPRVSRRHLKAVKARLLAR